MVYAALLLEGWREEDIVIGIIPLKIRLEQWGGHSIAARTVEGIVLFASAFSSLH